MERHPIVMSWQSYSTPDQARAPGSLDGDTMGVWLTRGSHVAHVTWGHAWVNVLIVSVMIQVMISLMAYHGPAKRVQYALQYARACMCAARVVWRPASRRAWGHGACTGNGACMPVPQCISAANWCMQQGA